ncbi:MAG: aminotransferase class V-fold PLP-dependent enzyme [Chloroflexota bacterium]
MLSFRREVYLDNNATTEISQEVIKTMRYALEKAYGNPSSLYKTSLRASTMLEEAREAAAKSINASPSEIIFTGSATESNNTALKFLFENFYPGKRKIISSPIEHPAVLETLAYLENRGAEVHYLKVNRQGLIDLEELENSIDDATIAVACMYVNNETGAINDIKKAAALAHAKGSYFFSDCVQALGKLPVDVRELDFDYASFSAHKINGPKGVGGLYVKQGAPIGAFVHGGHQERGLRAGTESIHNIAGFGAACRAIPNKLGQANRLAELKKYFIKNIRETVPGAVINSDGLQFANNTISVIFPGSNNERLMAALDFKGISVSAGSACNTQENAPSHVLKAIGLTDEEARSTIRFSLNERITIKDLDYTIRSIDEYFRGKLPSINMFKPAQLDESVIFSKDAFFLDVRYNYDRKSLKGIPNSFEASFYGIKKYLHAIPKDKNIIAICQGGVNSPFTAYYLKSKGYKNVSFLMYGLAGWRIAQPGLYEKYAGRNITKLEPKG